MAYAEAITPPVLTQIISSMASIMGVSPPLTAASSSPVHKPTLALHPSSSDTDLPALQMAHEPGPAVYGPAPSHYLPPWMHLPPALLNGTEFGSSKARVRRQRTPRLADRPALLVPPGQDARLFAYDVGTCRQGQDAGRRRGRGLSVSDFFSCRLGMASFV
jgi:hypothetical protein